MQSDTDVKYNCRIKYYQDDSGNLVPYEMMASNRQVFTCAGTELSEFSQALAWRLEYQAANEELFGDHPVYADGYQSAPKTKAELLDASRRRARRKIFDYCICNDFDLFITLTLDKSHIDRNDYGAVIKKINSFLGNRVRRRGLKYIGVPEYHQNGGLHFHFACTSQAFRLVDSGTVSVPDRKKPIKVSTADRLGIPSFDRRTVYNVADWRLGFSTAIYTYGDRGALAHYMSKELCKDVQKRLAASGTIDKIGGRWYLHGGKLNKPICKLQNVNFRELVGASYEITTDGGDFKVYKFGNSGEVLR